MRSLDCILHGDDDFLLEIARSLRDCGHQIVCLVTSNPRALAWAREQCITTAMSMPPGLSTCDLIVHADLLQNVVPQLAPGTLALRLQSDHGDAAELIAGAIAAAHPFIELAWMNERRAVCAMRVPISTRDTAGAVVDRCHRLALEGFAELATALAREGDLPEAESLPQAPVDDAVLTALHRLHFELDAAILAALPRAVDFGSRRTHAGLRLAVKGTGLTVGHIELAGPCDAAPGRLLAVDADGVVIAARGESVRLGGLRQADGGELDAASIAALFAVGERQIEAPYDCARWQRMCAADARWTTAIEATVPAGFAFLESLTHRRSSRTATAASNILRTALLKPTASEAVVSPTLPSLIAAAVAATARLLDAAAVSVAIGLPTRPDPFAARLVPATFATDGHRSFAGLALDAERLLMEVQTVPMLADTPRRADRSEWSRYVPIAILSDDGAGPDGPLQLRVELAPSQGGAPLVRAASLEWDGEQLEPAFVTALADSLASVWRAGCSEPATSIAELPLLSDEALGAIVASSRGADVPAARDLTLVALLDAAALQHAGRPAVSFDDICLDYTELRHRVWTLSRQIRARCADMQRPTRDAVVALLFERGIAMVVAILATLEAGAAYLPLDPQDPEPRRSQMIEDAAPVLALVARGLESALPDSIACLAVDAYGMADGPGVDGPAPAPDDLAYVIFTSGSTGRPKGAMLEHRGVANRIVWMQKQYGLQPTGRVLQKTPYTFDVSVWEFLWPLVVGAELVVAPPNAHKDPHQIATLVKLRCITDIHFVPSMLAVFLGNEGLGELMSLARIYCSGEALPTAVASRCRAVLPHAALHNLYGPTEASIDVSAWSCDSVDAERHAVAPLGRPIDNMAVHVLDVGLRPVPLGVPGELCIAGIGVARGYINRPALTQERFIDNPFAGSDRHMARLYRTGDVARWLPDGAIEFLGRRDFQIKIRGFRVELGEIEAALLEQPAVAQAVVARRDVGGRELTVAYLVPRGPAIDVALLGQALGQRLPDYMIPDHYVVLGALPLSANGKLDRRQLPEIELAEIGQTAIVDPLERTLAQIWGTVLKRPQIARTDHFFRIGGNSLLAGEMMLRVEQSLRVGLTFRAVFEHAVLCDLAHHIKSDAARPASRHVVMERL